MGDFAGAGKVPGIELWRIEKMVPTKIDVVDGKLYSGDSYILLSTTQPKGTNALNWHIHFWLGEETSQDEAGVAAYKTVELDDSLGGAPIQHRECQGHESDLFMSYFKTVSPFHPHPFFFFFFFFLNQNSYCSFLNITVIRRLVLST
jgi:advillin